MILIRTDAPHATPHFTKTGSVYSQLVYALKASDVDTVIVGGKIVMEHRRMLTLDEPQILAKAREYAKKVEASLTVPKK